MTSSYICRSIVLLGLCASLSGAFASAGLDLSDLDGDLMEEMDDAYKTLELVIPARSAATAKADAETLRDGLAKTERYFAGKGADDAAGWARDAQASTQKVLDALDEQNFDSALAFLQETKKGCRSCHDAYKPED